jgi:GxxExxY protein
MERQTLEQLAAQILDAAFDVHRHLGPGLLESAYQIALCHELAQLGIPFEQQKPMPLRYKGVLLDCGYRLDVFVAEQIVLELKCVEELLPIHEAQLLTYLKLANKPLGFLINFNVRLLKNGLKRIVNGLPD